MLLDGTAAEPLPRLRLVMSHTTATSLVASGVPVHSSTSATLPGGSRRFEAGHEVGQQHVVDGERLEAGDGDRDGVRDRRTS